MKRHVSQHYFDELITQTSQEPISGNDSSLFQLKTAINTRCIGFDTMLSYFEGQYEHVVTMNQVHGSNTCFIDDAYVDSKLSKQHSKQVEIEAVDGVVTTYKNILLSVKTADCLPVLLYHPMGLVGALHCGRKSTEEGLLKRTFSIIKKKYSIDTGFVVWFGPAICHLCYQIDREKDLYYKLIETNKTQLFSELSETSNRFLFSDLCTSCRNDLFFSYRKEGRKAGRLYSMILMS
jgi:copper oxidase (laccase) domain-containing protein